MTVLESIQKSTEFLAKKGVETPRLQAELLLAHVLTLPRMNLYLSFDRVLLRSEIDWLRELVQRRGRREPLQHVVGSASFCGLELAVNRHVLVPRPETEQLAEMGWLFLSDSSQPTTALDFGTGSGCLAISVAARCPGSQVDAVDVSSEALVLARQNAARHKVAERINFIHGNGFDALPPESRFDLVLGNPPYVPTAEIADLDPEVRDFDPHEALDGGPDGLNFYRSIALKAGFYLKDHGCLMLEFGDGQADPIRSIFEKQKWIVEGIREDYTQRPRILIAKL